MKAHSSKLSKMNQGYTLIETMISISLFIVVITSGIGSLISANVLHNKSQRIRSIMDNLSFIMEDMSRNLRTGYNYHCYVDGSWNPPDSNIHIPESCAYGKVLAFEETYGAPDPNNPLTPDANDDQWVYKISSPPGGEDFNIYKSIDGGENFVKLNLPEIDITPTSGFSVLGAEPPNEAGTADKQQPLVLIRLVGNIKYRNIDTPFALQTLVSERLVDSLAP